MLGFIRECLAEYGIDLMGAVPMSKLNIIRPYKLKNAGFGEGEAMSVIVFAIPYYTARQPRNISAYAVSRDYHLFAKQLFDRVLPMLREKFPQYRFAGFADNSPICEVYAAALAGLGIIGDNMLLITEKYSSYIFLGEIITDCPTEQKDTYTVQYCEHCGLCRAACPMAEIGECLSALTQKKGELTEKEQQYIKKYGSAWGCDICSEVCPHTKKAIEQGSVYSAIEFFYGDTIPHLSSSDIISMTDEQFSDRAYSWRGRNIILRNLKLTEDGKGGEA